MWQLPPLQADEIFIYLRKSRADDPLLSVEEVLAKHEQMLDDWMERNLPDAGRIPEKNRYREVVSGETIDSRPRVQELLRQVESPRAKAVLIVEPQRLSRGDLEDIGRLVKLLRYSNTLVITLPYTYDLRDERDRDMFERELKRGNEFLEYQKKIMNNGRLLAVQNGNYLGNRPPYGYKKIHYKEGKKDCYTLEPIPEEAAIVKLIFEMYRDGYGSHKIARRLNEMGVKTQKGGKWSAESLKKMRTNEHYLGKVVWNRRQTIKTVEDGEIVVSRPLSEEYLVYPGKQPAIIDQELWDAVQEIRNKIPSVKNKAKCVNAFAGLVYCQCGRIMSRREYKKNEPRLLCEDQVNCRTPSCTVAEMTAEVVKVLQACIEDFELKIKNDAGDSAVVHQQIIKQLEQRLEELNMLELSQWDKYTQEGMPKHIFDQLNAKVLREKDETQQALCMARDTLPEPVDYEQKRVMFSDALRLLQDPDAPALQQNMLLKGCIDHIEYNRKKKESNNRRWGTPEPLELDVHLRV
jgi:DNA invertase Pin-like site-specific DNA recombinase